MEATAKTTGGHRRLALVLIVLATIIGIVSVFALWGKRQVLENETFATTSGELIQDPEIQKSVADFLTTSLFTNVDVQGELTKKLPPQFAPLAGPATGALRNLVNDLALKALQQPKVQALWESAISTAHNKLIALIEDRGEFVSTTDGVVTVDLRGILAEIASQIGIDPSLTDKLPEQAASFEVMRSDELETAQRGLDLFQTVAYVLSFLTLVMFAGAVALAKGRRRETLRDVGIGFLSIGAIVLLFRGMAADVVVDQLSSSPATDAPIENAFTISTSLLKETGQSILVYGILLILAAWIAGPSGWATSIRRFVTPYLRQPQLAYGGLALVVALLIWWDPVVATHRLVPSLILFGLMVIGTEVLRRRVIREFPDEIATHSPAKLTQHVSDRVSELRARRAEAKTTEAAAAPGGAADRVEVLERLGRLHSEGLLTDEELATEKQRLLEA